MTMPAATPVKPSNNLVWGIIAIFLFWPLAIYSIYLATQVDKLWMMGDQAGAVESADKAKRMAIISYIIGAVVWVGGILLNVLVFAAASSSIY